ncbi:helix-turn-helix domain-containing protein [Pantoea ananatis]|uniref:helix-turn-helix domain-containing protein n=1 Tax=Pantoea ananas TaxID=553 RepID=UPI001B307B58|nr:helix-turn-helix domain-containing protein [Pantoea ananatis]
MNSHNFSPSEIKRLRMKAGLTQREAAELVGVSLNYWQRKELSEESKQFRRVSRSEFLLLQLLAGEHPDFILIKR